MRQIHLFYSYYSFIYKYLHGVEHVNSNYVGIVNNILKNLFLNFTKNSCVFLFVIHFEIFALPLSHVYMFN